MSGLDTFLIHLVREVPVSPRPPRLGLDVSDLAAFEAYCSRFLSIVQHEIRKNSEELLARLYHGFASPAGEPIPPREDDDAVERADLHHEAQPAGAAPALTGTGGSGR